MDDLKLKKANELAADINSYKAAILDLEKVQNTGKVRVELKDSIMGGNIRALIYSMDKPSAFATFLVLEIVELKQKLAELEKEYSEL